VMGGGANSGLDPRMWVAVFWNLGAWLAWGLLLMMVRYRGLVREHAREQQRANAALAATMEAA